MTINEIRTIEEFWKLQNEGKESHMYRKRDGEQDWCWKECCSVIEPINAAKFYEECSWTDKAAFMEYLDQTEAEYRQDKEDQEKEIPEDDPFIAYIEKGREFAAAMREGMTIVEFDGYFDIYDTWNVRLHDDVTTYQLGYTDEE